MKMKIEELKNLQIDEEITAGVCVIGGAGGGMTAAVSAYEKGVKDVVLLEKTEFLGGCTSMCAGFFAVESPAQRRLGITDTADDCFRQVMAHMNWNVNAKLVRNWITNSGDTVRWLEDKGLYIDDIEPFYGFPDVTRRTYHVAEKTGMHTGREIVKALKADIRKKQIPVYTNTRAQHLITDNSDGAVVGVYAVRPDADGKESGILIRARSVIIATGSISANKELIKRFYAGTNYGNVRIMANVPHNTGDGHIMIEEVGGQFGDIATLFIGPHNHGIDSSELTGVVMRRVQPIKVDRYGERFIDESVYTDTDFGSMLSYSVDRQPGKICYIICDEAMIEGFIEKDEILTFSEKYTHSYTERSEWYKNGGWMKDLRPDVEKEISYGRAYVAQTIGEAAEWIGCDPVTLRLTIEEYNLYCDNKHDDDFLKAPRHLIPLRKPPYYLFKGPSGIDTCIGGIEINQNFSVLDADAEAISGLYAAGICTSGWLNRGYGFQGGELSYTLFSGRH